jgi:hypothetical protein
MTYGYVVLVDTKTGFIPNAIKWFTGSQLSHSLVTVPPILNTPMCIEAAEGGVDMLRFDTGYINNPNEAYQVWSFEAPDAVKDAAILSIVNDLEITYGFLQYPWFIWRRINLLFGRDIKSQDNWSNQGMVCSQVCVAYLTACGLTDMFAGYGKGSISPQDLQDIFRAHPETFTLIETKS